MKNPKTEIENQIKTDYRKGNFSCPVCRKEIHPPLEWWSSVNACSDCVRKVALEIQKKERT